MEDVIQRLKESGHDQNLELISSPAGGKSSVGSAHHSLSPADEIVEDTPCILNIPLGRTKETIEPVAYGTTITAHTYRNTPAPFNYSVVCIEKLVTSFCALVELEHTTPDEISKLGAAVNHFVLWFSKDIILLQDRSLPAKTSKLDPNALQTSPAVLNLQQHVENLQQDQGDHFGNIFEDCNNLEEAEEHYDTDFSPAPKGQSY